MTGKLVTMIIALVALVSAVVHAAGSQQAADDVGGMQTIEIVSVRPGTEWELDDSEIGAVIAERTGVNLRFLTTIGDENEAITLMIASGDMPDVVAPHYTLGPFVDAGVARDITGLVQDHAPNLLDRYGPMWDRMVYSEDDSGRYYFGNYYREDLVERDPNNGFYLQHAVVMDQGHPQILTLDQFGQAIRQYAAKHPEFDGQPTIGISFDLRIWVLNLHNPAQYAGGIATGNDYIVTGDGQVTMHRRLPEHRYFYEWMNRMYNDGLLDPEAFTQTQDQFESKTASGRVLAFLGPRWQIAPAERILRSDGRDERTYGVYPVAAQGYDNPSRTGGQTWLQTPQAELVLPTSTSESKALAFVKLLDFVASTEGQILANWGLQGTHFDLEAGRRVWRSEVRNQQLSDRNFATTTGIGLLANAPFPNYQPGERDADGDFWSPLFSDDFSATYPQIDRDILDGFGVRTWQDLFVPASEFDFELGLNVQQILNQLPADDPARVARITINDLSRRDLVAAIIAPRNQFDAVYDRYLRNLEQAGIREHERQASELVRSRIRVWGMVD